MIAGFQLAENGSADSGHAGCRGARIFGTFQQAHALFEHVIGGARIARIDETVRLSLEARFCRFRAFIDKALGQVECFGRFTVRGAQCAAMYELSCRAPFLAHLITFKQKNRSQKQTGSKHPVFLATCLTWLQADRPNHHGIRLPYCR